MAQNIVNFDDFWLFYLRAHSTPACRVTHYLGTAAAITIAGAGIFFSPWFLLAVALVGYGPAWFGHFVIERNKPAVFGHPFWSFVSDFKMLGLAVSGRLEPELVRAGVVALPD
ncbi:MAG: Mpo1-like protein [Planctomycetaceae bacterium]